MTMVLGVLGREYALVVGDLRATAEDKTFTDGHPKLEPSVDRTQLYGVAGHSAGLRALLHAVAPNAVTGTSMRLLDFAGVLGDHTFMMGLVMYANFDQFAQLPVGEFTVQQTLHVFRDSGRFIACKHAVSKVEMMRAYRRDPNNGGLALVHAGVGGEAGFQMLDESSPQQSPFKAEWATLSKRDALTDSQIVFDLLKRVYDVVAVDPQNGVGGGLTAARMTATEGVWKGRNAQTGAWEPIPQGSTDFTI